jgi:hypothetical protein
VWFQHDFDFAGGGRPTGCTSTADFSTFYDGSNRASSEYNCQQTPGVTLHDMVVAITAANREIDSMNGVLLSDTAVDAVSTSSDIETMAKARKGECYIFVGAGQAGTPTNPAANYHATFTLADRYSGTVTPVDGSGHALPAVRFASGTATATLVDQNAIQIYTIPKAC